MVRLEGYWLWLEGIVAVTRHRLKASGIVWVRKRVVTVSWTWMVENVDVGWVLVSFSEGEGRHLAISHIGLPECFNQLLFHDFKFVMVSFRTYVWCCPILKLYTTLDNGSLGSRNDEERSELR